MPRADASVNESKALRTKILELLKIHPNSIFSLFNALQQHVVSLLPANYKGKKEEGYENPDEYLSVLRQFLPANMISDEELWIKDDDKAVDLNWAAIKQAFSKVIISQRLFPLTGDKESLLLYLTSQEQLTREQLDENNETFSLLFPTVDEVNAFLNYHDELPNAKKIKLIQFFATIRDEEFIIKDFNKLTALQQDKQLRDEFYKTVEGKKVLNYLKKQFSPNPFINAKHPDAEIKNKISLLSLLPRNEQLQILQEKANDSHYRRTALISMSALEYSEETFGSLLNLITESKLGDPLLLDLDSFRQDALILVSWKRPSLLPKLLGIMQDALKLDDVAKLLKNKDGNGTFPLYHLLSFKCPIDKIVEIIHELPVIDQAEIFKLTNKKGLNSLMRSMGLGLADQTGKLLTAISKLPASDQETIFLQEDLDTRENALSYAQHHNLASFAILLKMLVTFAPATQKVLLNKKDQHSLTVFQKLINEQKLLVLKSMMKWNLKDQQEVIPNSNAFMYALNLSQNNFDDFFALFKELPLENQKEILKSISSQKTLFSMVPQASQQKLLPFILQFDDEEQKAMINTRSLNVLAWSLSNKTLIDETKEALKKKSSSERVKSLTSLFALASGQPALLKDSFEIVTDLINSLEESERIQFLKKQLSPNPFNSGKLPDEEIKNKLRLLRLLPRDEQLQILQEEANKPEYSLTALLNLVFQQAYSDEIVENLLDLIIESKLGDPLLLSLDSVKQDVLIHCHSRPNILPKLVGIMKESLSSEKQAVMLKNRSNKGYASVRILLSRKQPIDTILELIKTLPEKDQVEIFKITDDSGVNFLMASLISGVTDQTEKLLMVISKLPVEAQEAIFLQESHFSSAKGNVLSYAQQHNSATFGALFNTFITFNPSTQKALLKKIVFDKLSDAQKIQVLKSMMKWNIKDQQEVFPNSNAFMRALHISYNYFDDFLALFKDLPLENRKELLKSVCGQFGPLFAMVPLALQQKLFPLIVQFDDADQKSMLNAYQGRANALVWSLKNKIFVVETIGELKKKSSVERLQNLTSFFAWLGDDGSISKESFGYLMELINSLEAAERSQFIHKHGAFLLKSAIPVDDQIVDECQAMISSLPEPTLESKSVLQHADALMLAISQNPEKIIPILNGVTHGNAELKAQLLSHFDSEGGLLRPTKLPEPAKDGLTIVLNEIKSLEEPQKTEVVKKITDGDNLLLFMVRNTSARIKLILEFINSLSQPLQNEIKIKLFVSPDALWFSELRQTNLEIIPELVASLQTVDEAERVKFFKKAAAYGWFSLSPSRDDNIKVFKIIAGLSNASQEQIFQGHTLIKWALYQHIKVDQVIEAIKALPLEEHYRLLKTPGCIELAAQYEQSFTQIMALFDDLNLTQKKEILLIINWDSNFLSAQPRLFSLVDVIIQLDKKDQKEIMDKLNPQLFSSYYYRHLLHTLLKLHDSEFFVKAVSNTSIEDLYRWLLHVKDKNDVNLLMATLEKIPEFGARLLQDVVRFYPNMGTDGGALLMQLLKDKSNKGLNVLMTAAKVSPSAVKTILAFEAKLKPRMKDMFMQKNEKGAHALMIAIAFQPEAAQLLWDALLSLKDEEALKKLLHNEPYELNPLKIALTRQSELLPVILQRMIDFNDDKINAVILSQLGALIGSIPKNPELFTVLSSITNPELKKALYTQSDSQENNFLMNTIESSPENGLKALEVVSSFDEQTKSTIYQHTNQGGLNALFLANAKKVSSEEEEVSNSYRDVAYTILDSVFDFEDADLKKAILAQKNPDQVSALRMATSNLIFLGKVLAQFEWLPVEERKAILMAPDKSGFTLLHGESLVQSGLVPDILEEMIKIDDEDIRRQIVLNRAPLMRLAQNNSRLFSLIINGIKNSEVKEKLLTQNDGIAWKIALNQLVVVEKTLGTLKAAPKKLERATETLKVTLETLLSYNKPALDKSILQDKDLLVERCVKDADFLQFILGLRPDFVREILCHQHSVTKENLMMGVLKAKSPQLLNVSKAIMQLNDADKIAIFTQINADNQSILGVTIKYYPERLAGVMVLVNSLNEQTQRGLMQYLDQSDIAFLSKKEGEIGKVHEYFAHVGDANRLESLMQVNQQQENALMVALRQDHEAVPSLLKQIGSLDEAPRETILQQCNRQGLNVVMMAVQQAPQYFPELLNLLQKDALQKASLIQTTKPGKEHALALALIHNPESATVVLNELKRLCTSQELVEIIKHTNANGMNVLMLAVQYAPALVPELLGLIPDSNDKKVILRQTNTKKENALMLALEGAGKSASIKVLINEISTWDDASKKAMLQHANQAGSSLLVLTAELAPEYLGRVFEQVNQVMKPAQLWSLLENHSMRILEAAKKSPQIIPVVLKNCSKLPVQDQAVLYQVQSEKQNNLLSIIGSCEVKMQALLIELAEKEEEFKYKLDKKKLDPITDKQQLGAATSLQKAHFAISSIRENLQSSLETYRQSDRERADVHLLKTQWEDALKDKTLMPIVEKQRSLGKIIGGIILSCLIIGLAFALYEKVQRNKKGQGFFETNSAHLLRQLSDKVHELNTLPRPEQSPSSRA